MGTHGDAAKMRTAVGLLALATAASARALAQPNLLAAAAPALVKRQTTTEAVNALNELSTIIPGDCSAACATFLTSFQGCLYTADQETCICDTTFLGNVEACGGCIVDVSTTNGDTASASTAQTDVATATGACGAVDSLSASSTDLSSTEELSTDETSSSSSFERYVTTSSTSSTAASTSETSTTMIMPPSAQTTAFPEQTKSSNVFAGAAAPAVSVAGPAVAAAVAIFAGAVALL